MRDVRDFLDDLKSEADAVARFTSEGKTQFLEDDRIQYAVMMAYARIGEIVKNIPDELLATQPQVEWKDIKGFRDVLMHRYFDVNVARVWEAVEKLPALQAAIEALLAVLPDDDDDPDVDVM